jgi:hypothetical protein
MRSRSTASWIVRVTLLLSVGLLAGAPGAAPVAAAEIPGPFAFQWTGNPSAPQPWQPKDWDLIVHARDQRTWTQLDPMPAQHGADCGAPPATHTVTSYDDAVFICRNHMMTAFWPGGYGEIEFAPSELADWSGGTTVISWHQSTFRTSPRDWTDLMITPLEKNLVLQAQIQVDLKGRPRDAVDIEMCGCAPTKFTGAIMSNFQETDITTDDTPLESAYPQSAVNRTHFQLEISRTHIRFGIPEAHLWWVDRNITPLSFTRGLIQFGHHSYTPDKECVPTPGVLSCVANTWHWSDFSVSSAVPFTMLRGLTAASGHVSDDTSKVVQLPSAAPANSHLRFAALGRVSVSFDSGRTWVAPTPQPSEKNQNGAWDEDMFYSYWVPAPEGTTSVTFRGQDTTWGAPWWVSDPAVWSSEAPATPPTTSPPAAAEAQPAQPPSPSGAPVAQLPSPAATAAQTAPRGAVAAARGPLGLTGAGARAALVAGLLGLLVVAVVTFGLIWMRRRRTRLPAP